MKHQYLVTVDDKGDRFGEREITSMLKTTLKAKAALKGAVVRNTKYMEAQRQRRAREAGEASLPRAR